jgi:cyclophilin family peptidyl-prolyl cis-trans isomerase
MIRNNRKLKMTVSEKILLIFLTVILVFFIIFFLRISNKCLLIKSLDEEILNKYKNEKIIILEAPCGKVAIKLFIQEAPLNTKQVLNLIKKQEYDNSFFYRVKKNKLVEFGDLKFGKKNNLDYLRIGTGGSSLKNNISELSSSYSFKRGSVGMVKRGKFDTENSQIFILLDAIPSFDGQYTPIGEVVGGIEILDKIKYSNNNIEFVLRPDYIKKIYVHNFN